jgi:hypothetical protein
MTLDLVDLKDNPLPDSISNVIIRLKGTKNLFDIYFNVNDLEKHFKITIPPNTEFVWITTDAVADRYITYVVFKKLFHHIKDYNYEARVYMGWVDGLLFQDNSIKPFYNIKDEHHLSDITDNISEIYSDFDSVSVKQYVDPPRDDFLIIALQHKIHNLEQQLVIKDKDIQLRDKDIEILELKLQHMSVANSWI